MKTIKLLGSGLEMPIVGLGTWRAQPQEVENAVSIALDCGYRHIDTAFNYNNEESIGKIIKQWVDSGKGKREDLFITTKLPNFGNRASDVERFINLSLKKLQLDYVDLYLMHMPFSFHLNESAMSPLVNEDGSFSLDMNNFVDTWKDKDQMYALMVHAFSLMDQCIRSCVVEKASKHLACIPPGVLYKVMEEQVEKGLVKAIGVSNFNAEQLRRLYDNSEIKPAVLQVELHAYLQQKKLRDICKNLNVAVTAYSPLGSPGANNHFTSKYNYSLDDFPDILGHPVVQEIAQKYNKTPGQVLLKHLVQQDVIVIPKSGNPDRIKSNISLFDFELSSEDLERLGALDKGDQGRIFDFLFFKGVENHPEYPFKKNVQ